MSGWSFIARLSRSRASNIWKRCLPWRIAGEPVDRGRAGSGVLDRSTPRPVHDSRSSAIALSLTYTFGAGLETRTTAGPEAGATKGSVVLRPGGFSGALHLSGRLACGIATGGSRAEFFLVLDGGRAGGCRRIGVGGAECAEGRRDAGCGTSNDYAACSETGWVGGQSYGRSEGRGGCG